MNVLIEDPLRFIYCEKDHCYNKPHVRFSFNSVFFKWLRGYDNHYRTEFMMYDFIRFLDVMVLSEILIYRNILKNFLNTLHKRKIITLEQRVYYRKNIRVGRLYKNVKYQAIAQKDTDTLISLLDELFLCSIYCKNDMILHLIYRIWDIDRHINLDKYLHRLTKITIHHIFEYDIAHINTLTKIEICPYTDYTLKITTGIANFIEASKHVLELDLSGVWNCDYQTKRLCSETIQPILQALKQNQSITSIDFSETFIQDDDVLYIAEHCKQLQYINLADVKLQKIDVIKESLKHVKVNGLHY